MYPTEGMPQLAIFLLEAAAGSIFVGAGSYPVSRSCWRAVQMAFAHRRRCAFSSDPCLFPAALFDVSRIHPHSWFRSGEHHSRRFLLLKIKLSLKTYYNYRGINETNFLWNYFIAFCMFTKTTCIALACSVVLFHDW